MKHLKLFNEDLIKMLPCFECQKNYKSHLLIKQLTYNDLYNTNTFIEWFINFYNTINKRYLTLDEFIVKYNIFNNNRKYIKNVCIFIIFLIVVFLINKHLIKNNLIKNTFLL